MNEILTFTNATLGPIKITQDTPLNLTIRPLTVLIGVQGSGKSLVSQLLYFLRDAPYLIANYGKETNLADSVRSVVNAIRSGRLAGRDLTAFVPGGTAQVHYLAGDPPGAPLRRGLAFDSVTHQIAPIQADGEGFEAELMALLRNRFHRPSSQSQIISKAMFIPAERTFFSRFLNSDARLLSSEALPVTMLEFSNILARGRDIFLKWQSPAERPPEFLEIEAIVEDALRGQIRYEKAGPLSGTWQWVPRGGDRPIQIEMASSGQMEAWPLFFAAETAFGLPENERPRFLHIEEPEAHLHPSAQVAMVNLLAYLVNKGFRVLVTTHSLTVLYALNNLMAAYQLLPGKSFADVPPENIRLNPDDLSAYLFTGDGVEEALSVTDELRQIDEGRMGEVLGNLQVEFNRIVARATYGD